VQIGLKKNDFDISDKEALRSAIVKKVELRKDEKTSWKTIENTSINL